VVVGGDEDDLVDALGLELVLVLGVRDDVLLLARGSKCAGNSDDDDLLVLGLYSFLSEAGLILSVCLRQTYPCLRHT
jgi:hypothetical protein